jgi:hypothetical protein
MSKLIESYGNLQLFGHDNKNIEMFLDEMCLSTEYDIILELFSHLNQTSRYPCYKYSKSILQSLLTVDIVKFISYIHNTYKDSTALIKTLKLNNFIEYIEPCIESYYKCNLSNQIVELIRTGQTGKYIVLDETYEQATHIILMLDDFIFKTTNILYFSRYVFNNLDTQLLPNIISIIFDYTYTHPVKRTSYPFPFEEDDFKKCL